MSILSSKSFRYIFFSLGFLGACIFGIALGSTLVELVINLLE